MELMLPSTIYKNSFLKALDEYHADNSYYTRTLNKLSTSNLRKDFASFVSAILSEAYGQHLPEGYVPQTTFWLIDKHEFIGRVSIRHTLTDFLRQEGGHIGYDIRPSKRNQGYGKNILALSLPKAKELGITRVLVTCDETNTGSKKIIESNGGILENRLELHEGKPAKLRYWITIT